MELEIDKSIIKLDFVRNNLEIISPKNVRPRIDENKTKNVILIDLNMQEDFKKQPSGEIIQQK